MRTSLSLMTMASWITLAMVAAIIPAGTFSNLTIDSGEAAPLTNSFSASVAASEAGSVAVLLAWPLARSVAGMGAGSSAPPPEAPAGLMVVSCTLYRSTAADE